MIKISILTPTLNCVDTLPDCLSSISNQTYKNIEHIILDGKSTDGTVEVIEEYLNESNTDIIFHCKLDKGIYDALNSGLKVVTGDVVGFLHSDDLYANNDVLSKIATVFEDHSICAVYGDLQLISRQDITKVIRHWVSKPFKFRYLKWGWMPPHPTLYVRRDWYSKINGFDPTYLISADYLSILKLFGQREFRSIYLPMVFVKARLGGVSNKSFRNTILKLKEDWSALRIYGFGIVESSIALIAKNITKLKQFKCKAD